MKELIKKNYQLIDRLKILHGTNIKIRIKAVRSNRYSITSLSASDFIHNRTSIDSVTGDISINGGIISGILHTKYAEVRNYTSIGESQVHGIYLLQNKLSGSSPGDCYEYAFNNGWHISVRTHEGLFYIDYMSDCWLFAIYLTINGTEMLLEDWLNKEITLYDLI